MTTDRHQRTLSTITQLTLLSTNQLNIKAKHSDSKKWQILLNGLHGGETKMQDTNSG